MFAASFLLKIFFISVSVLLMKEKVRSDFYDHHSSAHYLGQRRIQHQKIHI